MRYECKVVINASLEKVSKYFLEHMVMCKTKSAGSTATFPYKINDKEIIMKETIESNDMPNEIVTIYEVEGVWNRCINKFLEEDGKVSFTMDTEFIFYVEMDVNEDNFRNKTQSQMEDFKKLVENN